jgi:hypothetical protein
MTGARPCRYANSLMPNPLITSSPDTAEPSPVAEHVLPRRAAFPAAGQ